MAQCGHDRIVLSMMLAHDLHQATYDLAELCGDRAPDPHWLWRRFLGWITRPAR